MTERQIVEKKDQILLHLAAFRVKAAFSVFKELTADIQDWKVNDEVNHIETSYKLMLHYLFEDMLDPERDKMYNGILQSLYEHTEDLCDILLTDKSGDLFYRKSLSEKNRMPLVLFRERLVEMVSRLSVYELGGDEQNNDKVRALSVERERLSCNLFDAVFTAKRCDGSLLGEYRDFLFDSACPLREKCLLVSAVTLNLFHRFDALKMQFLMDVVLMDEPLLKARATVALVLLLQVYENRFRFYPELLDRLSVLSDDCSFVKDVEIVLMQLVQAHDTEKVSKKVTEDIMPEMIKFNRMMGDKLGLVDLSEDLDMSEKNPQWKKEFEESDVSKKMQEYSELQMQGADVFHSTFCGLKSFPFFSELSNWFLPFDAKYSELMPLFSTTDSSRVLLDNLDSSGVMCDSDKYSFLLSLLQIPKNQRDMMFGNMLADTDDLKQMRSDLLKSDTRSKGEMYSNQYIQDLYRFFKLFPDRHQFWDIFSLKLNFYEAKFIALIVSNFESMKNIALYCFNHDYFGEALTIFDRLVVQDQNDADLWQKIGYCRQMLQDMDGALKAYLQADLLLPNHSWIIRRIAQLYRLTKQTALSLSYYQKASVLLPDNLSIEMNIGHCYLELNQFDKALNSYFRVELLDARSKRVLRPIAWALLLSGKMDMSRHYYERILLDSPSIHDYLNAGHVELCAGQKKNALGLYIRAFGHGNGSWDGFVSLFRADVVHLFHLGVSPDLVPWLLDEILYSLSD